jgi:starch phosphorylase
MTNINSVKIPQRISGLDELAYNLWWSWHLEARELFKFLDRFLWMGTNHNPVLLLQKINPQRLEAASHDPEFLKKYDSVMERFHNDISATETWFKKKYPVINDHLIAYFSLEFAIHTSLPLYAGGLGILAGDHCKEASDLGLPFVGVGFMYPQGYFHQHISADGWQEEHYEELNFSEAPICPALTTQGERMKISVNLDSREVYVTVWQVNVGRVKLYLLDTNIDDNSESDRYLSARLYAGDRELRLLQEIIIGIGGVRVLRALGYNPTVWHSNEGHTSFMMLERIRELVERGFSFHDAAEKVRNTSVFTTHTSVPAGNDVFTFDLMEKYFHNYWSNLNLDKDTFLSLGNTEPCSDLFNMTALGMRMAGKRNGVSKLHGKICHAMWNSLWPDIKEEDVPITSITNGVHVPTWVAPQFHRLYQKYLGHDWLRILDKQALWEKIYDIPDVELWTVRRWLKYKLVRAIHDRIRNRWCEEPLVPIQALATGSLLDSEVLIVGFCRRFAQYKRATLILQDIERLQCIVQNNLKPVQIVFAGKAHPDDEGSKHLIQQVYTLCKEPRFAGRIAFVEDYDMHMARYLVHGVDVWLNTPLLHNEASGTSGQKAAINGVAQLSVLDGWWAEGYTGENGWAIGNNARNISDSDQNKLEAEDLYRTLEEKVIPLYYDRDIYGIPYDWIKLIKNVIYSNVAQFSTRRMVKEYTEKMYLP